MTTRRYDPARDLAGIMGTASNPYTNAALAESARQERSIYIDQIQTAYKCPGCDAAPEWSGALFLHLSMCDAYRALFDRENPDILAMMQPQAEPKPLEVVRLAAVWPPDKQLKWTSPVTYEEL